MKKGINRKLFIVSLNNLWRINFIREKNTQLLIFGYNRFLSDLNA